MADAILTIALEAQKATKALNDFKNNTEKQLNGIQKGFNLLRVTAAAAVTVIASRQLLRGLNTVVEAASRQEDAVNSLNTALRTSGQFSNEASAEIQKFASELQRTSIVGDEAAIEAFNLALAFGATKDQAKLVTQAAVELSAATGKSLEEATRQVSKTLGGFAGELGEVNPQIKALTQEQLKAGEAARILISQYGGTALAQLDTFSGGQKALNNAYGDTLEAIGEIIIKNDALVSVLSVAKGAFESLTSFIVSNSAAFSDLVTSIAKIAIDAIPSLVFAFKTAFTVISALVIPISAVLDAIRFLVSKVADFISILIGGVQRNVLAVLKTLAKGINSFSGLFGVEFEAINIAVDSLTESITLQDEANRLAFKSLFSLNKEAKDLIPTVKDNDKALMGFKKTTDKAVQSQKDLELQAQKTLTEVEKIATENETLRLSIAKIGKTTEEVAKIELDYQLLKIDNQIASIKGNTKENESLRDQLKVKRELLLAQAKLNSEVSKQSSVSTNIPGSPKRSSATAGSISTAKDIASDLEKEVRSPFEKAAAFFTGAISKSQEFFDSIGRAFNNAANIFNDVVGGGLLSVFANIGSTLINIPNILQGIFDGVDNLFSNKKQEEAISNIKNARDTELEKISQDFKNNVITADQANAKSAQVLTNSKNQIEDATKNIKSVFDSFPETFGKLIERIPDIFNKIIEILKQVIPTIIESLPAIVSDLANGIGDLAIIFAEKFIPQLIRSIPKVVDALLRSLPRIITALLNSLPEIFKAIAQALPELVEVLAENLTPITVALVEGIVTNIPLIVATLIDELIIKGGAFRIGFAIAKAMIIDLPIAVARGILKGLANLGDVVFSQLANIFSNGIKFPDLKIPDLRIPTPDWLDRLQAIFDSFDPGKIFGGGGGGGFIGQVGGAIGGALGFATGGTVPAGFPNDSFPARLTSGEEVISMDRSKKLDKFLNAELSQDRNVTINLQVGESSLAKVIYSLNQKGFRTA